MTNENNITVGVHPTLGDIAERSPIMLDETCAREARLRSDIAFSEGYLVSLRYRILTCRDRIRRAPTAEDARHLASILAHREELYIREHGRLLANRLALKGRVE